MIPRTTTTVTRVDGTTVELEHVDHDAVLDQWDALGEEVWTLEVGDLHNVIDTARDRIDAALELCDLPRPTDLDRPFADRIRRALT